MAYGTTSAEMASGAHVVRRPRPTDMVGQALATAFADLSSLPDDMIAALARIDCRISKPH